MKRISNTCNEASENGNIDGNNNNETRSGRRRRRRSLDDSISREDPAINVNTADVSESDQSKNEPYASLLPQQQDFPQSIENLDEKVGLPEYVKMHTNTLTFPEKVSLPFCFQAISSFASRLRSKAYDSTHSRRKGMCQRK